MDTSPTDIKALEPSFNQVPLNTLMGRVENGSKCLMDLVQQIQSLLECTQKDINYVSSMSRNRLNEFEILGSTSENAYISFKNYHLAQSKKFVQFSQEISNSIYRPLEELKVHRSTIWNRHKLTIQNTSKEVNVAMDNLSKAKKNYAKAKAEMLMAKEKLSSLEAVVSESEKDELKEKDGRFLMKTFMSAFESNPEVDRDKQQKRVSRRYNSLLACTTEIVTKKRILRDRLIARDIAIAEASVVFEDLEHQRLRKSREALLHFCNLEEDLLVSRLRMLRDFKESVNSIDIKMDVQEFIQQFKRSEITHKYSKALDLLDWNYNRKYVHSIHSLIYSLYLGLCGISASLFFLYLICWFLFCIL